jgi:hypothetical protein
LTGHAARKKEKRKTYYNLFRKHEEERPVGEISFRYREREILK